MTSPACRSIRRLPAHAIKGGQIVRIKLDRSGGHVRLQVGDRALPGINSIRS